MEFVFFVAKIMLKKRKAKCETGIEHYLKTKLYIPQKRMRFCIFKNGIAHYSGTPCITQRLEVSHRFKGGQAYTGCLQLKIKKITTKV